MKKRVLILCFVIITLTFSFVEANSDYNSGERYLKEVLSRIKTFHIDGDKFKESDLVKSSAKNIVKFFKEEKVDPKIIKRFEGNEFKSLDGLLKEIKNLIKSDVKINVSKLFDAAANGLLKGTGDKFARILTMKQVRKLMKILTSQRDDSFGFVVQKDKKGGWKIAYVRFGFPAYFEGLKIGDKVLKINGRDAKKIEKEEMKKLLKGKKGTKLVVRLYRKGWSRNHDFVLIQNKTKRKNVFYKLLPSKIGYLRMTIFDLTLASSVEKALSTLEEKGMDGLILDLRNNPGGALPTAVAVADKFLDKGKLITYAKMRMKIPMFGVGEKKYYTKKEARFKKYPIIVLVNKSSASASELLSGALQDHKRATLVGETTYGKGVGQSAVPLMSKFLQRFLYMTVMRYYLPSGRSVDKIGVKPDVKIFNDKLSGKEFEKIWELKHSKKFKRYISDCFKKDRKLMVKLANYDNFDHKKYPAFEEFYRSLNVKVSKDKIRSMVRSALRRKVAVDRGEEFVLDIQTDYQLQKAIVVLLKKLGLKKNNREDFVIEIKIPLYSQPSTLYSPLLHDSLYFF